VPVREESANFRRRLPRRFLLDGVTLTRQLLPVSRPTPKNPVQAQRRVKLRVLLTAVQPCRLLFRIQRVVCHHHIAHARNSKHVSNVLLDRLRSEKGSRLFQGGGARGQAQRIQNADDPPLSFRKGAFVDEQTTLYGTG